MVLREWNVFGIPQVFVSHTQTIKSLSCICVSSCVNLLVRRRQIGFKKRHLLIKCEAPLYRPLSTQFCFCFLTGVIKLQFTVSCNLLRYDITKFTIWFLYKEKVPKPFTFRGAMPIRRKGFMTASTLVETPKEQQRGCAELCVMKLCDGFNSAPHQHLCGIQFQLMYEQFVTAKSLLTSMFLQNE